MLLRDYFDYYCRTQPDATFLLFEGRRLSWNKADRVVTALAQRLIAAGVGPGVRVGLLCLNHPIAPLLLLALERLGGALVPMNYRLAPAELRAIAADAGLTLAIADAELAPHLAGGDITVWDSDACLEAPAFQEPSEPNASAIADARAEAILVQMYTSGTTGLPKGVLLSHGALMTNAHQLEIAMAYRLGRMERTLVVSPLYHAAAFIGALIGLRAGATLVIQRAFDTRKVLTALREQAITTATFVPIMIQRLTTQLEEGDARVAGLKHILYGGSAIAPSVLRAAMDRLGCAFTQAYGLTETSSAATALCAHHHDLALQSDPALLRSCGMALPATQIALSGDHGGSGEIFIIGPQLANGYWQRPIDTAEAFKDGTLKTGDVGSIDGAGMITIADRLKDMIISGGENIYSIEVEKALTDHPGVEEAAVFGQPHSEFGEAVIAVIVPKDAATPPSTQALITHCRGHLAGYKIPRTIYTEKTLPKTPSGKIQKHVLKQKFA